MSEFDSFTERIFRLSKGFPSLFNQSIPENVRRKLKRMPPMEDFYDPNIPRIQWITPWSKAVDKALAHNEKILKKLNPQ